MSFHDDNVVQVFGLQQTAPDTSNNGNFAPLLLSNEGYVNTPIYTSNPAKTFNSPVVSTPDDTDGQAAGTFAQNNILTVSRLQAFNGVSFDRLATLRDDGGAAPLITGLLGTVSRVQGYNQAANEWKNLSEVADDADNVIPAIYGARLTKSHPAVFDGLTYQRERAQNVFKTAQATALGVTTIWMPQAGKRFRLLSFDISLTRNATLAVAGILTLQLFYAGASIGLDYDVYVPATVTPGDLPAGPVISIDLGKIGYRALVIDNALSINLSVALATGNVRVNVRGTEEA